MEKIFGVKDEVAEGYEAAVVVPLIVDVVQVEVPVIVVTIEVRRVEVVAVREEPPSFAQHAVRITTDREIFPLNFIRDYVSRSMRHRVHSFTIPTLALCGLAYLPALRPDKETRFPPPETVAADCLAYFPNSTLPNFKRPVLQIHRNGPFRDQGSKGSRAFTRAPKNQASKCYLTSRKATKRQSSLHSTSTWPRLRPRPSSPR